MTAQIGDSIVVDGEWHALAHFSAGEPFVPQALGFRPVMEHTACWRGYVVGYAVRDARLWLDSLHVNHEPEAPDAAPPRLNGVAPAPGGPPWDYARVAMPLDYDGTLVAARDFLPELYVHMGFPPLWKYRHAQELEFVEGRLVRTTSLDARLDGMRREALKGGLAPRGGTLAALSAWIARTFDRTWRR